MYSEHHQRKHIDLRITIYRVVKQFSLILLIGFIIKYALCDTVLIRTDQMEPGILNGDRVILSKAPTVAPLKWFKKVRHTDPVVFTHPHFTYKAGCLRIAGIPGDTVKVQQGIFSILNRPELTFIQKHDEEETLPADYSPRDNMDLFRIPEKGDTIIPDSLIIRDIIFLYSMIKQENPNNHYSLKPTLLIGDSISNDYLIKDFPLFSGKFCAIPDSLFTDWFFWDRLKAYLISEYGEHSVLLTFSILEDELLVDRYIIKKKFYFLLSDNWCGGFDSRFGGPIVSSALKGKVVGILWSFSPDARGFKGLRGRRICKIIK